VDEGDVETVSKRFKGRYENVSEPCCTKEQPVKVSKNGVLGFSRVVGSISVFPPPKNSRYGKSDKLSLEARRLHVQVSGKVAQIPFPSGVHI
jgi:hypothetical protein